MKRPADAHGWQDGREGYILYRPHSTLQCGEKMAGGWHRTRQAAECEAVGWIGLPVGASSNFWIEEMYRLCAVCQGSGEICNKEGDWEDCWYCGPDQRS